MPKSLDGVAVRTCVLEVGGKSTCGPETLGAVAIESARLGFAMMEISGLTGSDDKRWDSVVYGVTDRSCTDGGSSVGAMRTQPGVSKRTQEELAGLLGSPQSPVEKASIEGLDFYVGYARTKDCIMAFGYPNDTIVLLAFAGKGDREQAKQAIKSMLGAAGRSVKQP